MSKLVRCAEDDPLRCQAVFANGQCPFKAVEHTSYCMMHGGMKGLSAHRKHMVHDYKIQQWQERVDDFAKSQHVKNLRGEIGILRMTLEQVLSQIKTPNLFPLFQDKISNLTRDIRGLVEVCQKIEEKNKELLTKTEVYNIADAVISIVSQYIVDPDALLEAGEQLHAAITGIASGENPGWYKPQVDNGSQSLGM